jgi:Transferrin receptor-like dimerisation domain
MPGRGRAPLRRERLEGLLAALEETLMDECGLRGRDRYKQLIFCACTPLRPSSETLPAIREAIEVRHWSEVNDGLAAATDRLAGPRDELSRVIARPRGVVYRAGQGNGFMKESMK